MFKKPLTMTDINSMTKEELDAATKRMLVKIVVTRLVLPIAAVVAVNLIVKKLEKDN